MLPDNRLDFISNISDDFINMMTKARKEFIAIDHNLRSLSEYEEFKNEGVGRCVSLARTNLETALQYSIKALCLMGEVKE